MLDVGETSSSQTNLPLFFPPSTSVSRVIAGHLAAIPTVTWPLVIRATIPLAKAVTPTLFVAPVHVFIFAIYDGVVVDIAEIAVAAVKTYFVSMSVSFFLIMLLLSCYEPAFFTLLHLHARLSRPTGSGTASALGEASRTTFSTARTLAAAASGSGRAKVVLVRSTVAMMALM